MLSVVVMKGGTVHTCMQEHSIGSPVPYHTKLKLYGSDSRVFPLSRNSREHPLFLSPWTKQTGQEREKRKTKKGCRERKWGERNEQDCVSHHMASMPMGHHHQQQPPPPALPLQPSQPQQSQPQNEVPRRSSDMETDKVLLLIGLIANRYLSLS